MPHYQDSVFYCQQHPDSGCYHNPVMKTLADRLRKTRKSKGWSGPDLAKKAGIRQSFIGALESGAQESSGWLPEIAHALGVDAYWLKTGVEPIIGGDKRINEIIQLLKETADTGRAIVLDKARDMAKQYPNGGSKAKAA